MQDRDQQKHVIRTRLQRLRDAVHSEVRSEADRCVVNSLIGLQVWREAARVALYRAIRSELPLADLEQAARRSGKTVCYPRCVKPRSLEFVPVDDVTAWSDGPFGTQEPQGEALSVRTIDLVVVPLLAFDRSGSRLGYGSGYYDRALQHYPGVTVAPALAIQEVNGLPQHETDIRLDWVVTETEVLRLGQTGGDSTC